MLLCSGCDVKLMNGIYLCHSRHISSFTALSCISCAPLFFHFSCLEAPGPNSLSAVRNTAVPQPPVRLVCFQPDHFLRQQPQYSQIRQHTLKVTLPSLQSTKVPREPILITQKWRWEKCLSRCLGGQCHPLLQPDHFKPHGYGPVQLQVQAVCAIDHIWARFYQSNSHQYVYVRLYVVPRLQGKQPGKFSVQAVIDVVSWQLDQLI